VTDRAQLHHLLDEALDTGNAAVTGALSALLNGIATKLTPEAALLLGKGSEALGAVRSVLSMVQGDDAAQRPRHPDVVDVEAREVPQPEKPAS